MNFNKKHENLNTNQNSDILIDKSSNNNLNNSNNNDIDISIQDNNKNNLENNEMKNTDTHKNNYKRKFINLNKKNTNDNEQLTIKKNKVLLIKTVNPKSYDEAINSNDSNK